MARPLFFSPQKATKIHAATLTVLEKTGVKLDHEEAEALYLKAGATKDDETLWIYVHDKNYEKVSNKFYLRTWSELGKELKSRGIADESYRVLKQDKHCGILIGDTRKRKHYIPISFRVMQQFLDAGFILKEDIIKLQHKVSTDRGRWRAAYYPFYKIMHEHIFVFRKPDKHEKINDFKASTKWW